MNRLTVRSIVLILALSLAFLAGGCAKKQVRTEGEGAQVKVEEAQPAPVLEEPIQRAEAPPPETAAAAPAPEQPVAGAGLSQETSPGLQRIHFDFDQSVIKPEAREILASNADYLLRYPGVQIRIEGHCDERGTTEYNLALGERRAKSAFQYLMDLGVDPNRMTIVSYGEEVPLDPRHNEEAWAMNRRAEFVETQR